MFANKRFTARTMPVYKDNHVVFDGEEHEPSEVRYIQAFIINDGDVPPKQLISIEIFHIPADEEKMFHKNRLAHDPVGVVSLLPEDAIKFARTINRLIGEVFNDNNYRK